MNIHEIYEKPFVNNCWNISAAHGRQALLPLEEPNDDVMNKIVRILNGDEEGGFSEVFMDADENDCKLIVDGIPFRVRGWGYLTTFLGLPLTDAAKLQDEFAAYCVEKLSIPKE